mgnify:CR=1 FL=1
MKKLDFNVEKLSEEHIKEIEKHAGFKQEKITEHYDELSANYEQIYLKVGWPDPKQCAELINKHFDKVVTYKEDVNEEVKSMGIQFKNKLIIHSVVNRCRLTPFSMK